MNNGVSDFPLFFRDLSRRVIAVGVLAVLAGCGGTAGKGEDGAQRAEGTQVFSRPTWTASNDQPDAPKQPGKSPESGGRTTWAILLGVMSGEDADRQAATLVALASQQASMPGTFIEKRGDGLAVLYGSYEDPGSKEAKRDLTTARNAKVAGSRPFESAIMAAPTVRGVAGGMPEYDLRNVKQLSTDAVLTLQVGIYLRSDGRKPTPDEIAEIRRTAEEAVRALRAAGDQAFYFHGAERSTICVGLFASDKDARIEELRKKHPLNMVNGQKTQNARTGATGRGQESFLVNIPADGR